MRDDMHHAPRGVAARKVVPAGGMRRRTDLVDRRNAREPHPPPEPIAMHVARPAARNESKACGTAHVSSRARAHTHGPPAPWCSACHTMCCTIRGCRPCRSQHSRTLFARHCLFTRTPSLTHSVARSWSVGRENILLVCFRLCPRFIKTWFVIHLLFCTGR